MKKRSLITIFVFNRIHRFLLKNLTISQISIYISLILGVINLLIVLVVLGSAEFVADIWKIVGFLLIASIIGYLVITYLLERYVFKKIRVIYNIIYTSKVDATKISDDDLNKRSLEMVNQEVIEWAESTRKELNLAKKLAAYRKNFVGNISHELKTPIFSIQGYLHTLLDGAIHDDKINMSFLRKAADNTERLSTIVNDLESISNLESGRLILDIEKLDIKVIAQEAIDDVHILAKEKGIKLKLENPQEASFKVMGDKTSIRQVFTNLLVNSIKYGKDGGETIVSFNILDPDILIEISDNGIGIKAEHIDHLFDRFYRVDVSRSRIAGGSGLGLSIVKHIIEAHNQTINVRSTPEVGSTFGFTLKKA